MQYEVLSRALAYVSCLSTMSLLATTMAMAAVSVGKIRTPDNCSPAACATLAAKMPVNPYGGLTSKAHVEAVAAILWSKKI
jgi:hypothetical protein